MVRHIIALRAMTMRPLFVKKGLVKTGFETTTPCLFIPKIIGFIPEEHSSECLHIVLSILGQYVIKRRQAYSSRGALIERSNPLLYKNQFCVPYWQSVRSSQTNIFSERYIRLPLNKKLVFDSVLIKIRNFDS